MFSSVVLCLCLVAMAVDAADDVGPVETVITRLTADVTQLQAQVTALQAAVGR
jgi:hypothetical protein